MHDVIYFKRSALAGYDKPDKQSVFYTMASPGAAQTGSSLAPNSFLSGNKLVGHSSPRQHQPLSRRRDEGFLEETML